MHAETNTSKGVGKSDSFTYQRSGTETPTEGVLEAVSAALDRPILPEGTADPLPPLYDALDPEALNEIFDGDGPARPILTFTYSGCTITVNRSEITVEQI